MTSLKIIFLVSFAVAAHGRMLDKAFNLGGFSHDDKDEYNDCIDGFDPVFKALGWLKEKLGEIPANGKPFHLPELGKFQKFFKGYYGDDDHDVGAGAGAGAGASASASAGAAAGSGGDDDGGGGSKVKKDEDKSKKTVRR